MTDRAPRRRARTVALSVLGASLGLGAAACGGSTPASGHHGGSSGTSTTAARSTSTTRPPTTSTSRTTSTSTPSGSTSAPPTSTTRPVTPTSLSPTTTTVPPTTTEPGSTSGQGSSGSSGSSDEPKVVVQPGHPAQVRPPVIALTADGRQSVAFIIWSSWGASSASGTGQLVICQDSSCSPSARTTYPATVSLSNPTSNFTGSQFTQMTVTSPGLPNGSQSYHLPI